MTGNRKKNSRESGWIAMFETDNLWEYVISVLFASAGGLAQLLYFKGKGKLKWSLILSELFISGFTGMMALKFCRISGLSGDWLGLVCGIAGWTSPKILFTLTRVVENVLKIKTDDLERDKK